MSKRQKIVQSIKYAGFSVVKYIVFPKSTAHWNVNIMTDTLYYKVSKHHVNTKCKFWHLYINTDLRTMRNKTCFFRLMISIHFGYMVRLILLRDFIDFYTVWTDAWAVFHLQNSDSAFENTMKTKAEECNFRLWKFITRDRSAKNKAETPYWYSIPVSWKSKTGRMKHVQIKKRW